MSSAVRRMGLIRCIITMVISGGHQDEADMAPVQTGGGQQQIQDEMRKKEKEVRIVEKQTRVLQWNHS